MKITIYGAGYVGLVTGTCFAELGNHVLCVDINEERIKRLQAGECPIHEPGLPEMMAKNREANRLEFTSDPAKGVAHGFYQFIAVGTPPDEDGSADLRYVLAVAQTIGEYISDYRIVINKSTVPVGTADKVNLLIQEMLAKRQVDISFDVVSNPEFLREGAAIGDFMKSDRVIVGADNEKAISYMRELYAPLNRNQDRFIGMDLRSAELTKYAANAFLATKISFMNEMSNIAERIGADIDKVRKGIGSDPRIGFHFINPGCGYGGSCFPKDVSALKNTAQENGYEPILISAVHQVNQIQKTVLFTKIKRFFNNDLKGKTIGIWGLSFKPNTDDMREASSRTLIEALFEAGAKVQAYDPAAMPEALSIYGKRDDFLLMDTPEKVLINADALAILTEWSLFFSPDFTAIKEQLRTPVIFDGRNLYEPDYLSRLGFHYFAIGRGDN
ncbi:MAG: UDP-glucose 6-dehydrogenase TuaD [Legionellaceae bacterium]